MLDMEEDNDAPIILGRPFLATGRVEINMHTGKLTLNIHDEKVVFSIFDQDESICSIHTCFSVAHVFLPNDDDELDLGLDLELEGLLDSPNVVFDLDEFFYDEIFYDDMLEEYDLPMLQDFEDYMNMIDSSIMQSGIDRGSLVAITIQHDTLMSCWYFLKSQFRLRDP